MKMEITELFNSLEVLLGEIVGRDEGKGMRDEG
jgi:hypothetical protein